MSPAETPRRNLTGAIVPALAAAVLAGGGALVMVSQSGQRHAPAAVEGCILDGIQDIGGPISLIDAHGATVTQADFTAQPSILYFGYTHCPDVCPTTMYALTAALDAPGGYDVQPVLITVDPERDTPQVLDQYVHTNGFPAGLIGLSGSRAQIDAAANAFKVVQRRAPIEGAAADVYNVDHSSFLYVMDQHWRTRAVISTSGRTPEEIAQCVAQGLDRPA